MTNGWIDIKNTDMGTAVVRGGFTSIIRGEVSPAWAKLHHRLWYDRVTGK